MKPSRYVVLAFLLTSACSAGSGGGAVSCGGSSSTPATAVAPSLGTLHVSIGQLPTLDMDALLAHVKTREQFGVPIGSFQAVKHKAVDMYAALERARVMAYYGALVLAERPDGSHRALAASMAKVAAGECQRRVVQDGLQLMGGIGYTWDHDLHLYLKRAKAGDALFGTAADHRRTVAHLVGLSAPDTNWVRSPVTDVG